METSPERPDNSQLLNSHDKRGTLEYEQTLVQKSTEDHTQPTDTRPFRRLLALQTLGDALLDLLITISSAYSWPLHSLHCNEISHQLMAKTIHYCKRLNL